MTQIYFHPTVMYCFFRICSCNFSDGLQIVHGALLINRKFKKNSTAYSFSHYRIITPVSVQH